jgi:pimeloyl-ACP methyl ester carboxylesterase
MSGRQMVFIKLICYSLIFLFLIIPANAQTPGKQVVVFVHGAWGGAWSFKKVDSVLTEKGYIVYRPTLTGLGEKCHLASKDIGLETHINDVVNMFLFEDLHDVILVGHSYGGMVITGAADRVADRIKKIIYLDAFVPDDGESLVSLQGGNSDWIDNAAKDGLLAPFWPVPANYPKDVPHPVKTLKDAVKLTGAASKIPTSYILTVDPGKTPEQDGFYGMYLKAKNKGWALYQMEADHNPQLTKTAEFSDLLIKVFNK